MPSPLTTDYWLLTTSYFPGPGQVRHSMGNSLSPKSLVQRAIWSAFFPQAWPTA